MRVDRVLSCRVLDAKQNIGFWVSYSSATDKDMDRYLFMDR